ncbi:hypothetical protein G647_07781 [Cladophialophora carrionii CBS 160.54]|uniref:Clr5 domain-containing protein n=1 Tax=Cladophialophora carrionii CBS 160.54 TaxID=1279043 RepID=V9D3G6_9EURO|nr:uncharacterized protein G647_07781 [Cladophialophora carrionii CBS 160.54]ETI21434.1 hypothetical protein G647_07781 [Cladophialophora carrionii CBS 160.54]
MSNTLEGSDDELISACESLPDMQAAPDRGFETRLSAPISPAFSASGVSIAPSNLMQSQTSNAFGVGNATLDTDFTVMQGVPSLSSVDLPPLRTHDDRPPKPDVLHHSTTLVPSPFGERITINMQEIVLSRHQQVELGGEDSGGGSLQSKLRAFPQTILEPIPATTEHKIPELGPREQSQSNPRRPKLQVLLNSPQCPVSTLEHAGHLLPGLAEVGFTINPSKEVGNIKPHPEQTTAAAANIKRKRRPTTRSSVPRTTKTNQRPGRKYENQWRVGQAPTAGLRDSKEQTNFDRVLAAVSGYYQGNADGTWKVALHNNASEYEGKGLTEAIGASIIMAAGLIAAGQAPDATQILNRTLPLAEVMLLSQHPQLCYWLTEVSMDTSQTVAGSVRRAVKAQFTPLACKLLGPNHPISLVLRMPLTMEQQVRMRLEAQAVAHDYHVRTFGKYSYQTMAHQWYWGRITAASGQFDEAVRLLKDLTQNFEQLYSTPNSAVAITALVEQARVMMASGDAGIRVECLLCDALRRIEILCSAQSLDKPILDAAELRLREGGLVFARLAALRALGRVHAMRLNLSAAVLCFEQAMTIARAELKEQSSLRKLCETDLEVTRIMELERAMGVLWVEDPTSRLPPVSSIISLVPIET